MKEMLTMGRSVAGPKTSSDEELKRLKLLQEQIRLSSALGGADPKALQAASSIKQLEDAGVGKKFDLSGGSSDKSSPQSNANMNKSLRMAEAGMKLAGVGDGSNGSTGGGMASGALQGASLGAMIPGAGPVGIAVGAGLGGTLGALKAKSARKKMRAEAQARMHERLGEIEGNKALRLQEALSLMAGNIGATLRSV